MFPETAMILAAGQGKRMGSLTKNCPKPLLKIGDKAIIDHILDRLWKAGIKRVVINHHYLGSMIVDHFKTVPNIILSEEKTPLETGGGVKNALPLLGESPFFVINGDVLWDDGTIPALHRLAKDWKADKMAALLLLHPTPDDMKGDYRRDTDGNLTTQNPNAIFTGIHLTSPSLYRNTQKGAFSNKLLWDRAESEGRLYGLIHDSEWYHLGTAVEFERSTESKLFSKDQQSF